MMPSATNTDITPCRVFMQLTFSLNYCWAEETLQWFFSVIDILSSTSTLLIQTSRKRVWHETLYLQGQLPAIYSFSVQQMTMLHNVQDFTLCPSMEPNWQRRWRILAHIDGVHLIVSDLGVDQICWNLHVRFVQDRHMEPTYYFLQNNTRLLVQISTRFRATSLTRASFQGTPSQIPDVSENRSSSPAKGAVRNDDGLRLDQIKGQVNASFYNFQALLYLNFYLSFVDPALTSLFWPCLDTREQKATTRTYIIYSLTIPSTYLSM